MKLVILEHPSFFGSRSMVEFSRQIGQWMSQRGHSVRCWRPMQRLYNLKAPRLAKKWLGYVDQYLIYPYELRRRLVGLCPETLIIVPDQALGMWVPLVANRPHVIHCHDLLALRAARGEFPQHRVRASGRCYQEMILKGFRSGRNFISVSHATREDLHRLMGSEPVLSIVVHNALNYDYKPLQQPVPGSEIASEIARTPERCLIHVGAGVWYKNREGVIELYRAYLAKGGEPMPLWMIGDPPDPNLVRISTTVGSPGAVRFFSNLTGEQLNAAYCHARALIFPSYAEGFGWPVAEAMTCGVVVLTTAEAPMTEIGGDAAWYLRRRRGDDDIDWADEGAGVLSQCLSEGLPEREERVSKGLEHARRFVARVAADSYEEVYCKIVNDWQRERGVTPGA